MKIVLFCGWAEQMMITYDFTDTFDVTKSSFLKLMLSLLQTSHPLFGVACYFCIDYASYWIGHNAM